jgi:predicted SAM-dependent methyltransferase
VRVLHLGCGNDPLPDYIPATVEVRMDADEHMKCHVVGDMRDLGDLADFDIVFCRHALEHLCPEDVGVALQEMHRVLKPNGTAWIEVPDLEDIVVSDKVLYTVGDLEVTALDMIYGHRRFEGANPWMAHRTGFTAKLLEQAFRYAGFSDVITRRPGTFNLIGIGIKGAT